MGIAKGMLLAFAAALIALPSWSAEPFWPKVPQGQGSMDALRLVSMQELSKGGEIAASESIVKTWHGVPVLVFSDPIPSVRFPAGTFGPCELEIGYVSGGSYADFAVNLDGVELGRTKRDNGDPEPRVVSFKISHGGIFDLVPLSSKPLAIYFFNPKFPDFTPVPSSLWKSLGDGRFECVFFNSVPFTSPLLKLESSSPCEIFIKGKSVMKCDGKSAAMTNAQYYDRFAKVEARLEGAAGADAIKLSFTSLPGQRFLPELPSFLSDNGHVDDWPRATISNGQVEAIVAIPDPEKSYYRGQRFEEAGIITSLKYGGHEFAARNGPAERNPAAADHVSGPAEEFWDAVGYGDDPDSDGKFMKIGSGVYEQSGRRDYFFGWIYWPVERFTWKTTAGVSSIEFRQDVSTKYGWGYEYVKRVSLSPGKPELVIEHEFKNTGSKRLASAHYSHNFLLVDKLPPGPDYSVEFGFKPEFVNRETFGKLIVDGSSFSFKGGETLHSRLNGCLDAKSCSFKISHKPTGASISITESEAPFRQALFICGSGICPESFVRLDLAPGESMKWSRAYLLGVK